MENRLIRSYPEVKFKKTPVIMGVLNVTPDSFSDGGKFFDHNVAVQYALKMVADGADIIDIGGESTRPGSDTVSTDEELRRIVPIVAAIREKSDVLISIDTTKSKVAEEAISKGASMVNDVSAGTFDKNMFSVAAHFDVSIVLMHMRGCPKTMQTGEIYYDDVVGEIATYLKERIEAARGVGVKDIIIDPGIGFGKTVAHNVTILKELRCLKSLGFPILIGTSRKSFIGKILGDLPPENRFEGTLATIAIAVQNGADILRVHDVKGVVRFIKVLSSLGL